MAQGINVMFVILLISIVENAGLMGLPLPKVITKALEVLREKAEFDKE